MSNVVAPKMYRNRLVFVKVGYPRKSKSEKKKEVNKRFRYANQYAKHVLESPEMKELYAKGIDGKKSNAHTVAVADYLNAPVIHSINTNEYRGAVGDKLRIKVTDDFQVTSVKVIIGNGKGKTLEQGEAIRYNRKPDTWVYTATVKNAEQKGTIVTVTAMDRPQNKVEKEVVIG